MNADRFLSNVRDISGFRTQVETGASSWFGFSIILEGKLAGKRSELVNRLSTEHIESRPVVTGNFTRQPVMKHLNHAPVGALPAADELHDNGLYVGNHHYNLEKQIDLLCEVLLKFQGEF